LDNIWDIATFRVDGKAFQWFGYLVLSDDFSLDAVLNALVVNELLRESEIGCLIITALLSELTGKLIEELCLDLKSAGRLSLNSSSALGDLNETFNSHVRVLLDEVSDVFSLSAAEKQKKDEAGTN